MQFDLNVELTYTVEEEFEVDPEMIASTESRSDAQKGSETRKEAPGQTLSVRKVEKTFSFDTRVELGMVSSSVGL